MWIKVLKHFEGRPRRLAVVRALIENGLGIRNGKIYCNRFKISTTEIAKAVGVDRRTVIQTIQSIEDNQELKVIFQNLSSAGHSLREVARYLGFNALEITPTDARMPGILAGVTGLLAERGISIRQAIVDDPELHPEPKLTLIVEKKIPGEVVSEALKIEGVAKVSIS